MLNKFLNTVSLYFGYSKSEVRGMLLLLILSFILLFIPVLQRLLYQQSTSNFVIVVDTNIQSQMPQNQLEEVVTLNSQPLSHKVSINDVSEEFLISIGVNRIVTGNLIKYLRKGGIFKQKSDLMKIYQMDAQTYELIINHTIWEQKIERDKISTKSPSSEHPIAKNDKFRIDINAADTLELKKINGIGTKLAQRIVKYRDILGGFVNEDQLNEVYGLNDFSLNELKNNIFIAANFEPQKIKINQSTYEQLSRHPYLGNKKSKVIHNYLKNHGKLVNFEEFQKTYPFTEEELTKIKGYLSYE